MIYVYAVLHDVFGEENSEGSSERQFTDIPPNLPSPISSPPLHPEIIFVLLPTGFLGF